MTQPQDKQPPRQTEAEIDAEWKLVKAQRAEALVSLFRQERESHAEELRRRTEENSGKTSRETLADRLTREAKEQGKDMSSTPQSEREHDPGNDWSRR